MKTTTQAAADARLFRLMQAMEKSDREKLRALVTAARRIRH